MKKILLATTTLVGAAGLFAGAALADTPKVTIGGYANFEAGYVSDDMDQATTATQLGQSGPNTACTGAACNDKQRPDAFRSDTQVDFKIDGKNDSGLGYGGEVDLLADTSADVQGRGVNASKTMVYMEGTNWGRFELGSNVGADGTMKVDAGTIARATGGINGDWNYFANAGTQFLAQANSPLGYGSIGTQNVGDGTNFNLTGDHTEENIDKITYYTPRFAGVQLGLSYLPDETNRGQGTSTPFGYTAPPGPDRSENNAGLAQNIFTGGINYDNKFGDVGFTVAATGEYGKSQVEGFEDLRAWNAGAKATYMGFGLAGSYGNWGKSGIAQFDDAKDSWYWDLGVSYEYGPFGASVTYLQSTYDCGNNDATPGVAAIAGVSNAPGASADCQTAGKDKFDDISVGVDYKLAPGLTPYAELTFYNENAPGSFYDNKGTLGIVGTQLNF